MPSLPLEHQGWAPSFTRLVVRAFEQAASIWSHDLIFTLNQLITVNVDAGSP